MKAPFKNFIPRDYPDGSITQWFAENPNLYRLWGLKAHNGVDCVAPWGTPILAVEAGEVALVKENSGYGKYIKILSGDNEWTYGHLSRIDVKNGQMIEEGEQIGLMGNTGFVVSGPTPFWEYNPYAGTHLHLGKRIVKDDPKGFRYAGSKRRITILNHDNGYKGAVDFREELEALLAPTRREQMLTIISLLNTLISLLKRKNV